MKGVSAAPFFVGVDIIRAKNFLPLFIVICAAIGILYWQFVYIPLRSEIKSMWLETQRLQMTYENLLEFENRHDVENFSEMTRQNLYQAQKYLPADFADDGFIAEIYRVAENNGVMVNSVRIGERNSDSDEIQRQSIQVNVDGKYVPLLNFIREILDGDRMVNLNAISIDSDENFLSCNLTLLIYSAQIKN